MTNAGLGAPPPGPVLRLRKPNICQVLAEKLRGSRLLTEPLLGGSPHL
jgi:hypothetical protein